MHCGLTTRWPSRAPGPRTVQGPGQPLARSAVGAGAELCDACTPAEGPWQAPGKGNPGQCYSKWILDSSQGKTDAIPKRTHSLGTQPLSCKGKREKESPAE